MEKFTEGLLTVYQVVMKDNDNNIIYRYPTLHRFRTMAVIELTELCSCPHPHLSIPYTLEIDVLSVHPDRR